MEVCSIASGSSGNCVYVGSGDTHLLIDAGISGKRIEEGLSSIGVDKNRLNAILLTHEHSDHIQGVNVLAKRYRLPVFGTRATLHAALQPTVSNCPICPEQCFTIGQIMVRSFSVSHDALDPICYTLEDKEHKIGIVTDLGMYDTNILQHLEGSELLYIEANHDVNMLLVGRYPYPLKQRILGDRGHLSNDSTAKLVCELQYDGLKQIILAHLSKENNYAQLAYETVRVEVEQNWRSKVIPNIEVANRNCPSKLISL